jgi:hypothetical protein
VKDLVPSLCFPMQRVPLLDGSSAMPLPLKTRFSRIPTQVASRTSTDPFDRLYLGAFGPHGPEVLRLVRGRWWGCTS